MMHVAEDPDAGVGRARQVLPRTRRRSTRSWQTPECQTSSVHSHATTVDELRAEGIYEVVTPEELVDRMRAKGPSATCDLHPLVGGMPIDEAWRSVRLYVEDVLPALD